jgi:hypothetical protein
MIRTIETRQGAATFFLKLFLFLLPLLIGFSMLEMKVNSMPTALNYKKKYIEAQLDSIEILSMGSSHGAAIDPDSLEGNAFNLSYRAQDLYYDLKLMQLYIDRMPNLRLVILPISYFSLEYQMDKSINSTYGPFYFHTWQIPPQHFSSFFNAGYFNHIAAYGWDRVVRFIENGFGERDAELMEKNGWWILGTFEMKDNPHESEMGLLKVKLHEEMMIPETISENERTLEEILQLCAERQVKVLLVTIPAHHTYFDSLDPGQWKIVQDFMTQLTKKYNVPYKNYLTDPRFAHSTTDFHDHDHLNTNGSIKFTQILEEEVIKPMLAQPK